MLQCPSKGRRNRQGPGDAQAAAKPVPSPKHNPGPAEKPPFSQSCPQPFKRLYQRRALPEGVFSFLHEAEVGREVLLLCLFFSCTQATA